MKGSSSFTELNGPAGNNNATKPPRPPTKADQNQMAPPSNTALRKNGKHSSKIGSSSNLDVSGLNPNGVDVSQKKLQKKKSNVKAKSSGGGVSFKEINDVISPDMDIPLDLLRKFKPKFNEFQSRKVEFSTIQVMSYSKNNEKSTNSPRVRKSHKPRDPNENVIKINISNENNEMVETPAKNTAYIRKRLNEEEIELIEPLENDSYISIFKAFYNDRFIILKIVEVNQTDEEAVFDEDDVVTDFQNEHDIYEKLLSLDTSNINNIISIYAGERVVLPEKENRLYAVMACEFGRCSMEDILRSRPNYSEAEIISLMLPLLSGLIQAHTAKVVHRELEPKNFTLSDNFKEYVICGFGRGVLLEGTSDRMVTNEIIQKKAFLSSELMENYLKFKEFEYDPYKADVYSLGVSVLCMMGIKEDSELEKLKTEKTKNDILGKLDKKYPKIMPIVRKMLHNNPIERISTQDAFGLFEKLAKNAEEIDEIEYLKKYEEYLNNKNDLEAIAFLEGIAQGYRMLKSYKKCVPYLERALGIREKTSGKNSLEVALCLDFIGSSYCGNKEYDQAIEYYKKALTIKQSLPGDNNMQTNLSYYYLGVSLLEKNDIKQAIENFSKAIDLRKKAKDAQLDQAKFETSIGICYSRLNNHNTAINHLTNGLNLRKQYFEGKGNHLLIAESLNCIGSEYYDIGDYKTALEFYEKTLKMRKNILGEYHPEIATCYHNIGATNDALGHHEKAVNSYEQALTVLWKLDLEDTAEIARTYNNLGETYNRLGDYNKSLELHYKSLKIYREIYGDINAILIKNLLGIANSLLSINEVDKAKLYYEDSLNMTIHIYGETANIIEIGKAFSGLGNVFLEKGDLKKSLEFHKKSIGIFQELNEDSIQTQSDQKDAKEGENIGLFNLEVAMEYNNIGKIYEKANDNQEAIKYYEDSLKIRKKCLGDFHPEVIISLKNLASINEKLGQKNKAFELLQETLVIRRKFYGEDHALVASTLKKLAELSEKTKS